MTDNTSNTSNQNNNENDDQHNNNTLYGGGGKKICFGIQNLVDNKNHHLSQYIDISAMNV